MTIRINNITLNIEEEKDLIKKKVAKKLKVSEDKIEEIKILKESIDARKKDNIKFNYCVEVKALGEKKLISKINDKDIKLEEDIEEEEIKRGEEPLNHRPVVIGFGPAGIFASLTLAQNGYNPIVFERGEDVDARSKTVDSFWKGESDLNCLVT